MLWARVGVMETLMTPQAFTGPWQENLNDWMNEWMNCFANLTIFVCKYHTQSWSLPGENLEYRQDMRGMHWAGWLSRRNCKTQTEIKKGLGSTSVCRECKRKPGELRAWSGSGQREGGEESQEWGEAKTKSVRPQQVALGSLSSYGCNLFTVRPYSF